MAPHEPQTLRIPDRRRHPRLTLMRPCKVGTHGACRFAFARTRDVSRSGAMLEMDLERPLNPGDRIDLAVAWRDEPVLPSTALIEAKVIRVLPTGKPNRHAVAVEFQRAAMAQAA